MACVFRLGHVCGAGLDVANPAELRDAMRRLGAAPPTVDMRAFGRAPSANRSAPAAPSPANALHAPLRRLLRESRDDEVVLVRLALPPPLEPDQLKGADPATAHLATTRAVATQAHRLLGASMGRFGRICPELVDRSKRKKRECTNVC